MHNGSIIIWQITCSGEKGRSTVGIVKSLFAYVSWFRISNPVILKSIGDTLILQTKMTCLVILGGTPVLYITPVNSNVIVSVWSTLFVLHSNNMKYLMNDNLDV